MAVDEAILSMHTEGKSPPTLRLYQWSPPAISLGYFQRRHGIDLEACQRLGIDVIKRATGGRAVLHFCDLTYSVVAGTADGIPSSVASTYRLICEGLLTAFRALGFEAEFRSFGVKSPRSDICFFSSTMGDILYEGKKFVGSAQTWHGSSMLQHGSITLEPHLEVWTSLQEGKHAASIDYEETLKREMTSIKEILGHVLAIDEIASAIRNGMTQVLGIEFREGELSPEELSLADRIANHRVEKETTLIK
jgi:lipoate-protein ligase A